MHKIGLYLTTKVKNAAWLAFLFALLSFAGLPTAWVSGVIIALVTMRLGPRAGLVVIAWAALPALALSVWGEVRPLVSMVLLEFFVLWAFACILRRGSWAQVLQAAMAMGIFGVIICHLIWPELQNWWMAKFNEVLKPGQMNWLFGHKPVNAAILAQHFSQYATGLIAAIILLTNLFLLFIARAWHAALFNPGAMRREFYRLRMALLPSIIAAIGLGLMLVGFAWAQDLLAVLVLPFIFAGMSLVHVLVSHKKQRTAILVVFYLSLVLLSPYSFLLVALIGWIDSWYNFRSRSVKLFDNQQQA